MAMKATLRVFNSRIKDSMVKNSFPIQATRKRG